MAGTEFSFQISRILDVFKKVNFPVQINARLEGASSLL